MSLLVSRKRLVSGLFAGVFGLLIVGLGGWWFTLALGLIVHLALLEFFRMAQFTGIRPATKTTLVACQILLITTQLGFDGSLPFGLTSAVLPLSGAAICGWLLLQPVTGSIADIAASIFGLFYLGFLPSHWLRLRNLTNPLIAPNFDFINQNLFNILTTGTIITLISCLIIVSFDITSYFIGCKFGKRSLSPISPGKTIEGALAGLICAMLIGGFSSYILGWEYGAIFGLILGILIAFFALVGDLTESMMKRDAGVKDSGNVLPGHGGILDRIDSYLFTPAVIYYFIVLIFPLITN